MECALKLSSSSICSLPRISHYQPRRNTRFLSKLDYKNHNNEAGLGSSTLLCSHRVVPSAARDVHKQRSSLESLFCFDKSIPEEIIEKPVGISFVEKDIGGNLCCPSCQAKGAILCTTCSGSGLYVDSILESQGIIVKVRCLGCGGCGNTMCSECGGRGHI